MKRIIIIGATSGIGLEVARCYLKTGWQVGVAGRREEELEKLRQSAPGQVCTQRIDVTREDAPALLEQLIMKNRRHGCVPAQFGHRTNKIFSLSPRYRITDRSHQCFGIHTDGQCRLSLFRTARQRTYSGDQFHSRHQGTGIRPAYSATKRFQNTYLDALDQLAHMNKLHISFTDIRPGFVATPLLKDDKYPLLMYAPYVASQIVRAISRRKRVAVIDRRYQMLVFFWKLIPGWLWVRLPVRNQ